MTRDASAVPDAIEVPNAALRIGVKVMPWIPSWLKRLLAGGRRVTIDGNTLDTTLQLILAATQRSTHTGGPSVADAVFRASCGGELSVFTLPAEHLRVAAGIPGSSSCRRNRARIPCRSA